MEGSITFSYRGAVSDAISESRSQHKLLVVYISGEDETSIHLGHSTWMDQGVEDSVFKYCIFLHLRQGSIEASQFSAIYPQNSIPSLTVVGLNGVVIWKHEGYVTPRSFVESMEKAWATLHLQETATTFLKAALTSRTPGAVGSTSFDGSPVDQGSSPNSETSASPVIGDTNVLTANTSTNNGYASFYGAVGQGGSSIAEASASHVIGANIISPSTSTNNGSAFDGSPVEHGGTNNQSVIGDAIDEPVEDGTPSDEISSVLDSGNIMVTTSVLLDESYKNVEPSPENRSNVIKSDKENASFKMNEEMKKVGTVDTYVHTTCTGQGGTTIIQKEVTLESRNSQVSLDHADNFSCSQDTFLEHADIVEGRSEALKLDSPDGLIKEVKSNDVHLNIRWPNGVSLRAKFVLTDTLRIVRSYADENRQVNGITSYDLAVPYPRKVFNEQDMNRTLCELGFGSREALIIVPHHNAGLHSGQSSSNRLNDASEGTGGYFGLVKRAMSYLNPFSYFVGNSSSSAQPTTNESLWQYRSNPALQGYSSHVQASQHRQSSASDSAINRRGVSTTFGSNIHTLRDMEDESSSADRNTFWNGNSTQYGGNDK